MKFLDSLWSASQSTTASTIITRTEHIELSSEIHFAPNRGNWNDVGGSNKTSVPRPDGEMRWLVNSLADRARCSAFQKYGRSPAIQPVIKAVSLQSVQISKRHSQTVFLFACQGTSTVTVTSSSPNFRVDHTITFDFRLTLLASSDCTWEKSKHRIVRGMTAKRSWGRRAGASVALVALAVILQSACVYAEDLAMEEYQQHHGVGVVDQGCRACRSGNCSHAVDNKLPGAFCGDLVMTLQPCCCSFRNECMTTIFSESCECFNSEEEEELMTTRFYLFIVLTLIAWVLLIYDKMCGAPYKVMNSSHVLLANSPSAARSVAGSDSEEDQENQQQQIQEADDSAQVELTIMSSPRAGSSSNTSDSIRNASTTTTEASTAPSLSPSSTTTRTTAAADQSAAPATRSAANDTSIQSV